MGRASRIILIIVGLLVVVLIAGAVALGVLVRRPFPETNGTIELEGLEAEVSILRDEYGVPHIYGANDHDLYFAQGYVHAQDRFWQMEFWRHIGQGRLAEMLGADLLETDRFIRTVGWNRMAETALDYYEDEPEAMAALQAYSDGVNAYLADHGDAFSLSQMVLGVVQEPWEIEPWEPLDTISWSVVMSWNLSGNWDAELARARMNRAIGEATTTSLLPGFPYDSRPVIAPTDELENRDELPLDGEGEDDAEAGAATVDWSRVNTSVADDTSALGLGGAFDGIGSNNWVVAGEHTDTGMPLLANDPHLAIQMPSIWYEVGLHGPEMDVVGFSFAGVPGIILGHNDRIAWGVTNVGPDVQDLYIEKINPNNPLQYEFEGSWRDMDVFTEVIKVKGGEDVELEIRATHHGPIINDVVDDATDPLALRWTMQDGSRLLRSVLMLNKGENYEDFREALSYWDVPSQNFVYADVEGNIAYQTPGQIPLRRDGDGTVPVPGWTGEYEWEGFIPYAELPAVLNPDDGFIVTANQAVVDEEYPYFLGAYWADGDRGLRIEELIEEAIAGGEITKDDFGRIQMDGKSLLAESYVPLLRGMTSDDNRVQAAIERLRGWDLQMGRDSVPAALFEIFYMQLAEAVLADDLAGVEDEHLHNGGEQRIFFHQLAQQPDAAWWDDISTAETETQDDIIMAALSATVDWFEENVGGNMEDWDWGAIHTATFVSDPLGQSGIGIVESIVNRGPIPVDGSTGAVNANSWNWEEPARVAGHPSMRMIVDLSDFDASRAVHPTGQSGHPFHPHYDDFIELWQNGDYHPMWFTEEATAAAAVDELILRPPTAE